jgi:putative exporter of polyketide antibiotics
MSSRCLDAFACALALTVALTALGLGALRRRDLD